MFRCLENVRAGLEKPRTFVLTETTKRSYNFTLSKLCDIENVHSSGVNSLEADNSGGRYLLSGCADGSIYVHDLYNLTGSPHYTCKSICQISKDNHYAHKYSVECVQWYPFDTGLFTTSSMDKTLKIWDTNMMKPAEVLCFKGRISQHQMSKVISKNSLIAVATTVNQVLLAEVKSGLCCQELRGHTSSVITCKWSPTDEYLLATGSCDNRINLWDIRCARSCIRSLDQHNGKGHSKNDSTKTAHDGFVNGLCFTSNGLFLLSVGTDCCLRLWNVLTGQNQMINFGYVTNDSKKSIQLDVSANTQPILAYVPSEGNIFVYETETGQKVNTLLGHYNSVNCCYYHPEKVELYSGGHDRNILAWVDEACQLESVEESSKQPVPLSRHLRVRSNLLLNSVTADGWSSDEDA